MFYGNPRIYNGDGIYNGGGGGSGTFDVDIGGGVSQTLVFPPYLVPVEYIDNSNANTNNTFCMMAAEQIPVATQKTDLYIKFVFQANKNYIGYNTVKPYNYTPAFIYNTNDEIRANVRLNSITGDGIVEPVFGYRSVTFSPVDLDKKLTLITRSINGHFILQEEGGMPQVQTDTRTAPSKNMGHVMIFNYQTVANQNFRGKIFYGYIKNETTGEILSLLVPARSKNTDDKKPYIVECVSGSVLINCSEDLNALGFEFGPDIDLSSEIPNWIT